MRIVIDTNVVVSAIVFGGQPWKLIKCLTNSDLDAYASIQIVEEYKSTLLRLLKKYPEKEIHTTMEKFEKYIHVLPSHSHIEACRDPDDNKFIECAIDNRCIYIVSGDKDLLVLEQYEDIGILTVSEFLEQYEKNRHKNSTKN